MELTLNYIFYLYLLICFCVVIFVISGILPAKIKLFRLKTPVEKHKDNLPQLIQTFFSTKTTNDELGKVFIELINLGYFQCLKTGNHGADFPDEKQHKSFMKYANPEIAKSLRNVGDKFERYIV